MMVEATKKGFIEMAQILISRVYGEGILSEFKDEFEDGVIALQSAV